MEALIFSQPPWLVRQGAGRQPSHAMHMLHKDTEQGFFMVADFDFDFGEDGWTQTVAAVRLRTLPRGLAAFIEGLQLGNGVNCVLRGECVYVFVGPYSMVRSPKLKVRERAACLDALEGVAVGDYKRASRSLTSIPISVAWSLGPWAVWAAIWFGWLYFLVTSSGSRGGLIIVGLVLASVQAAVHVGVMGKFRSAREYAARRTG